jgi:hypothetical protein
MSGFTIDRNELSHLKIAFLRRRVSRWLTPLAFLAYFLSSAGSFAQSVGPDEAVNAAGGATRQFALTETQKATIYNVVLAHRIRNSSRTAGAVTAAVGAQVSATAELARLPDQAAAQASVDDTLATDLKYAMVGGDLVVVDPIGMRVIGVIHRNARP